MDFCMFVLLDLLLIWEEIRWVFAGPWYSEPSLNHRVSESLFSHRQVCSWWPLDLPRRLIGQSCQGWFWSQPCKLKSIKQTLWWLEERPTMRNPSVCHQLLLGLVVWPRLLKMFKFRTRVFRFHLFGCTGSLFRHFVTWGLLFQRGLWSAPAQ